MLVAAQRQSRDARSEGLIGDVTVDRFGRLRGVLRGRGLHDGGVEQFCGVAPNVGRRRSQGWEYGRAVDAHHAGECGSVLDAVAQHDRSPEAVADEHRMIEFLAGDQHAEARVDGVERVVVPGRYAVETG